MQCDTVPCTINIDPRSEHSRKESENESRIKRLTGLVHFYLMAGFIFLSK